MSSTRPLIAAGVLVGLLGCVGLLGASAASAQDFDAVSREVVDIEGATRRLLSEPLERSRLRSATYVEERITDGELFYRLQDYVRASIIFTDVVENHPRHRAFPDALFLLGESLFRAGDYLGARTRFRELIGHSGEPAFTPYLQRALGRLIEIAIHTRDFDGVEGYFQQLSRIPPSEIEATTNYFRAKYLYNRAVPTDDVLAGERTQIDREGLERARQAFEAVQQGSPYYSQARYFIGVIYTLREEYPQAIEAFRRVLRSPADTAEQRRVIELTQLALGRLYYETDQLDQAVEAYQSVPRTSSNFHIALYEIAWVYIRMGDSTRAERALEVLAVAAPDSRYIPDAQILRGNLLLRDGRYDDANTIFREVARRFGPVHRELDEMIANQPDPLAYFRMLVRENMEHFDAQSFLPPLAQRWAYMEGDMDRALSVLDDLSQARRLVRETAQLIERLEGALGQPNRVAVFPDLRRHMERSTALRTRVARARRDLFAVYERQGGRTAQGDARRAVERQLDGMPVDETEFRTHDDEVLTRYRRLGRELGRMEVELQGMEARIVAMERYLADTSEDRDPAGVEAFRNELANHRQAVEVYREQIERMQIDLEAARLQVGVGDSRYQQHERLREQHRQIVSAEIASVSSEPIRSLLTRLESAEAQLSRREGEMRTVADQRASDMMAVVREESENVVGYRAALTELEGETEDVVGAITYDNFRQVQQRFYDLVLRADVGRIDVAWQRREEHRMRIEMLTRDRARELQILDDEFREIMDETGESSSSGEVEEADQ